MASPLVFAPRLPAGSGLPMAVAPVARLHPRPVAVAEARSGAAARARAARAAAVYRRRRLLVALALVLVGALVGTVAASVAGLGARAAAGPAAAEVAEAPVVRTHVVAPGDTLWSIAVSLGGDGDIRATVDELAARNGGSVLQVGQRLSLID
jgi:nucleoid-associated protein YgaU